MSKTFRRTGSNSAPVMTGPQRVLVITAKGRRRWGWIAPDGTVVDNRSEAL